MLTDRCDTRKEIKMTKFRYLALAGILTLSAAVVPANAALIGNSLTANALTFNSLTFNALTFNALNFNALTSNALVANGLLQTGSALGDLNGVTIEAVSTVHH